MYYQEYISVNAFLIAAIIAAAVGLIMALSSRTKDHDIYAGEGFVIVAFVWIIMSLIGCLPFCISGGTQRAEGTGTILSPLPELTDCAFVVIKEGEKLSTGDMYKKYDSFPDKCTPDTETLIEAICEGNVEEAAKAMANVFEPLWGETAAEIKSELLECGAINAVLSGSGPSIFGVFADESNANAARSKLSDKYENIYVCTPVSVKNIDE